MNTALPEIVPWWSLQIWTRLVHSSDSAEREVCYSKVKKFGKGFAVDIAGNYHIWSKNFIVEINKPVLGQRESYVRLCHVSNSADEESFWVPESKLFLRERGIIRLELGVLLYWRQVAISQVAMLISQHLRSFDEDLPPENMFIVGPTLFFKTKISSFMLEQFGPRLLALIYDVYMEMGNAADYGVDSFPGCFPECSHYEEQTLKKNGIMFTGIPEGSERPSSVADTDGLRQERKVAVMKALRALAKINYDSAKGLVFGGISASVYSLCEEILCEWAHQFVAIPFGVGDSCLEDTNEFDWGSSPVSIYLHLVFSDISFGKMILILFTMIVQIIAPILVVEQAVLPNDFFGDTRVFENESLVCESKDLSTHDIFLSVSSVFFLLLLLVRMLPNAYYVLMASQGQGYSASAGILRMAMNCRISSLYKGNYCHISEVGLSLYRLMKGFYPFLLWYAAVFVSMISESPLDFIVRLGFFAIIEGIDEYLFASHLWLSSWKDVLKLKIYRAYLSSFLEERFWSVDDSRKPLIQVGDTNQFRLNSNLVFEKEEDEDFPVIGKECKVIDDEAIKSMFHSLNFLPGDADIEDPEKVMVGCCPKLLKFSFARLNCHFFMSKKLLSCKIFYGFLDFIELLALIIVCLGLFGALICGGYFAFCIQVKTDED